MRHLTFLLCIFTTTACEGYEQIIITPDATASHYPQVLEFLSQRHDPPGYVSAVVVKRSIIGRKPIFGIVLRTGTFHVFKEGADIDPEDIDILLDIGDHIQLRNSIYHCDCQDKDNICYLCDGDGQDKYRWFKTLKKKAVAVSE